MVNEGSTLHKALMKYPKVFNNVYVSMAEAGETSGTLDVILLRLAEFTEAQNELTSRVKSAMLYPIIMLIATFFMLIVLFLGVIPKIVTIFEEAGTKLPWYTQVVFGVTDALINY